MEKFYTPETFDQDKYKRTGWRILLLRNNFDEGRLRLVVWVATGRKYWPLFTVLPNFEMGLNDVILKEIKFSLNSYTFPMVDRFIKELNVALSDLYQVDIDLYKIESGIKIPGYYSSNNF